MFAQILLYSGIFLAGLVAGLKVIAPLTKTKIDDQILVYAEDVEKVLEGIGGAKSPAPVQVLQAK